MSTYGLTPAGFIRKPFTAIRSELEADFREELGTQVVLTGGKWGRIIDVVAERESLIWEQLEAVYNARTPKGAVGVALDDVCAITGTTRDPPTRSRVVLRVGGTVGAPVPVGFTARVPGTSSRFRVTEGGPIEAGGVVDLDAEAEVTGPVMAVANTITEVVTPTSGVSSVTNPADVEPGTNTEKDPELRIKREQELRATGAAVLEAIRSRVLRVKDVGACTVFENTGWETNTDGMPPKSVEAVVQGGTDAAVALAVWQAKPGGIYTHGSVEMTVQDAAGDDQLARFSRPVDVLVYVAMTIQKGEGWPTDSADSDAAVALVKAAVVTRGDQLQLGEPVVRTTLYGPVYAAVAGAVRDVPSLSVGLATSPAGTDNVAIGSRQRARFDTSRIAVTLV